MCIDMASTRTTDLVICRYASPIAWLKNVDTSRVRVRVVNKGNDDLSFPIDTIPAANLGLDQDSILTYIIGNYDRLPTHCVFIQDEIAPHFENLQDVGVTVTCEDDFIQSMLEEMRQVGYTKQLFRTFKNKYDAKLLPSPEFVVADGNRFEDWFESHVQLATSAMWDDFQWAQGGGFGVHRDHILSRPLSYYRDLKSMFTKKSSFQSHYLERAWYYVFNLHMKLAVV